jgi:hypothetical protein
MKDNNLIFKKFDFLIQTMNSPYISNPNLFNICKLNETNSSTLTKNFSNNLQLPPCSRAVVVEESYLYSNNGSTRAFLSFPNGKTTLIKTSLLSFSLFLRWI